MEAIFVTGPLMESGQREHLRELAKGQKVRVLIHVDDLLSYPTAGDLVVTMAGYNSLYELLCLRKKELVVPRSGPSAEQKTRARIFAERGLFDVLYPGKFSLKEMLPNSLRIWGEPTIHYMTQPLKQTESERLQAGLPSTLPRPASRPQLSIVGGPKASIAYIVSTWPHLSQTFVLSEVLELERRGVELRIFSVKEPGNEPVHGEYMAAGRAVVASSAGQVAQIIRHRVNGLLYEPGDRAGFLKCLCELRKDPVLREELGRNARKASEDFTWERNAARVIEWVRPKVLRGSLRAAA